MRYGLLLLLGAVLACGNPLGPMNPTPFDPPSTYATWWSEAQACTKISASMGRIEWFLVDGFGASSYATGAWQPPHTIYLLRGAERRRAAVQHEMLHDLLGVGEDEAGAHNSPCFQRLL